MARVEIIAGAVTIRVETLPGATSEAILAALPLTSRANTWGDEVYFDIPVSLDLEGAGKVVMDAGDVAYWPPGTAIALAFGPTPVSEGDEMRLASAANIWARALDDMKALAAVQGGDPVTVRLAEG